MNVKNIHLFFIFLMIVSLSANADKFSHSDIYKVPEFTDANRAEKVKATSEEINNMYKKFVKDKNIPGLVYGVVLDGRLIYSGGFGHTNIKQKTTVNSNSLFRIASISKSFTSIAILQLRDAGMLNLDDPASQYLSEMKNMKYLTTDAPEITIRHLLTHDAGFPEDNPWGDRQLANTDKELMQLVENGISFSNIPGIEFEYSNLGYALLGQIVQKVSGMTFEKYTTEKILKPLGMNATVWEYEKANKQDLALGYSWIDNSHVNTPMAHHGSFGAMGGLITSIEDFTKFTKLHLSAWPARSSKDSGLLKRSSIREMQYPWRLHTFSSEGKCPYVLAYGYGLTWAQECGQKPYLSHNGSLPGFGSNWILSPEYGVAVFAFHNRSHQSTLWVNRSVFNKIVDIANLKPREKTASTILEKRKKALVKLLPSWKGAEKSGIFAENFFLDNRVKDLVKMSKELIDDTGEIGKIGALTPINHLRGEFIVERKKKNIKVYFTLSPEATPLIQQVRFNFVDKK